MLYLIGELVPLACCIIALVISFKAWADPKKALFPKLVAAGVGCMLLGSIHDSVYYVVTGSYSGVISLGLLGVVGCFFFLVSASYGQLDRLFDDGSKENEKYRALAFLAPLVLHIAFLPDVFSVNTDLFTKVVRYISWMPMFFSSYFSLKHALLPDGGFAFVKAVRPYNIAALVFVFAEVAYIDMYVIESAVGVAVSSAFLGASVIALTYFAKKGAEKWTI